MINKQNIITFDNYENIRLDIFLTKHYEDYSRSRIQALILQGNIKVDKCDVLPSYKLKLGNVISVIIPENKSSVIEPQQITFDIVYEDDDLLVINKPPGLVVHPGSGNRDKTLVNGLLWHCGDSLSGINGVHRPGIIHRLDKGTSGLLLVAKNDFAHQYLSKQFITKEITRTYNAVCWGVPSPLSGTINTFVGRSKFNRKKMAVYKGNNGKNAITNYRVLNAFENRYSFLECNLETGRTHQIRLHLAHIRNCVIGDYIYGRNPRSISQEMLQKTQPLKSNERFLLHAKSISFIHPKNNEKMQFTTKLPPDFDNFL